MEVCSHSHIQINEWDYDPTRSITLRNNFSDKFSARLRQVRGMIREAIIDKDVFGFTVPLNQQVGRWQFNYPSDSEKIEKFKEWLDDLLSSALIDLSVLSNTNSAWTNRYIDEAYRRGVQRARSELQKAGIDAEELEDVDSRINLPDHGSTVDNLRGRVINELDGVKNDILHYVGRILLDSFSKNHGRERILRRINIGLMQGEEREDLGLTELIGMFVAVELRFDMIARTEIVRTINEAVLTEYEQWGIEEVGLDVEYQWLTAGDSKVCPICRRKSAEGSYSLQEARGQIPAHVKCRCIWLPIKK